MKKDSLLEILRKHSFTNTLILDIWPPELGENKFGVFFMHLPCGTFLGHSYEINTGFPSGSDGTQSNVGDLDSIPGSGRSPGEVNGNPLQYSCLENPMDRGAWQATTHGVTKSWIQLSDQAHARN